MSEELTPQEIERINTAAENINLHGKINGLEARIESLERALEELKASLQHALDNPDHSRVDMTPIMEVYVLEYSIEDIDKALAAPSPASKAEEKP